MSEVVAGMVNEAVVCVEPKVVVGMKSEAVVVSGEQGVASEEVACIATKEVVWDEQGMVCGAVVRVEPKEVLGVEVVASNEQGMVT